MTERLSAIGRHTLIYAIGIIIGKAASFVMLPVYTRYLSPADYGVLELLGMTLDVVGMITGVGLVTGVFKFYSAETVDSEKMAVVSTAAIGVGVLAAITVVVGLVVSPQLSVMIFGSRGNTEYLRLYFLLFLLQNLENVPLLLLRAENRSKMFVAINTAKLFIMLGLNLVLVVHFRMGVGGAIRSSIIASLVTATALTLYLVRRAGTRFSATKLEALIRFGSPLVLWWLGSFVLVFSDRYFLNYFSGTSTVGIYSLAYKFAFLLNALAYTPFQTVWTSQRFEVAKTADAPATYARVFLYVNLIIGGLGLVLSLFVRDFLTVMSDPAFFSAYKVVPFLIAAQIVFTWADYWTLGIYISGKTGTMATAAIVLIPVTLVLNFLLIPRFGMYGAVAATMGAYSVRFFWIYHFAQRQYAIPYAWRHVLWLYVVFGGAVFLGFTYRPLHLGPSLVWNAALATVASAIVYRFVLSADDRRTIGGFVSTFRLKSVRVEATTAT